MDELVDRLVARLGVDAATARDLVAIVIRFLAREAPEPAMAPLVCTHPWIEALLADAPQARALPRAERHFGGMARLMEAADAMMACGLTMGQVQEAVRLVVGYARESVGAEEVDLLVRSVPGLRHVA